VADVFISYNVDDREFVRKVVQLLEASGWSVWWDRRIPTGKTWRAAIDSALADMKCMIVFWSKNSVGSEWVIEEADEGRQRKVLLPVLIDAVAPPRGFREIQAQDFQGWDGTAEAPCFRMLLEDMKEIVGASPPTAAPAAVVAHGFCLPWSSSSRASVRIRNALVLITDEPSLTASAVSTIAAHCGKAGKSLVVVAPTLVQREITGATSSADLAIEATSADGQPVQELLEDLAIYLGGYSLSSVWGFGLPQDTPPEDLVNGIARRFTQFGDAAVCDYLGKASEVRVDGDQVCFEAEAPLPDVRQQISYLKHRAAHCARSRQESNGLRERLVRFGAAEPIAERLVQPPSFSQDGNAITVPAGMASRFFMGGDWSCRLDNAKVLVAAFPLLRADDVVAALEATAADSMADRDRLLVVAPRIADEALALLVMNRLRGIVRSLAVETKNGEHLAAIARLGGARLIDAEDADHLSATTVGRVLGSCREVVAELHKTRIVR
jgi:hypothetical protein